LVPHSIQLLILYFMLYSFITTWVFNFCQPHLLLFIWNFTSKPVVCIFFHLLIILLPLHYIAFILDEIGSLMYPGIYGFFLFFFIFIFIFIFFLEFLSSVCNLLVGSDVCTWCILTLLMWSCDVHVPMIIALVVQIYKINMRCLLQQEVYIRP